MYSVEDLLISHGYKLPKSGPPSATPYDKRPADCQRELVDNRAGRGTLNGYEADRGASITGIYGSRQALVKGYPATDNESGERILRRKEAGIGILGDAQPLGDSLATDSGWVFFFPLFCDPPHPLPSLFPLSPFSLGPFGIACKTESALRRVFFPSSSLSPPSRAAEHSGCSSTTDMSYAGYEELWKVPLHSFELFTCLHREVACVSVEPTHALVSSQQPPPGKQM